MAQHQRTLPYRPSTRPGTTAATQIQTGTPVLRLRATRDASESSTRPRIQWAEDVVDNEGMGRKKSKVCCIYHAPRPVGESSSESSSDSSSDSESDGGGGDDGKARMVGKGKRRSKKRGEEEEDGEEKGVRDHEYDGCEHSHHTREQTKVKASGTTGKRKSRNAYERQTKLPKGGKIVESKS